MPTLDTTVEIGGQRYTIRRMPTSGFLRLMDMMAARPQTLMAIAAAGDSEAAMGAAMAPVMADLMVLYLTACVRPAPDLDALAPGVARELLAQVCALNPLAEVFEEFQRFFIALAPVAQEAAAGLTDGNGSAPDSPEPTAGQKA